LTPNKLPIPDVSRETFEKLEQFSALVLIVARLKRQKAKERVH